MMRFRYWIPALIWMGVIFLLSTDMFSSPETASIVEGILRWLFPFLSGTWVRGIHFGIRKTAHLSVYAALLLFYLMGLSASFRLKPRLSPKTAALALVMATLYACTDEWHQSFSPLRLGTPTDVLFDSAGALAMLGFLNLKSRFTDGRSSGS
jgi:VanZ family protein